MRTSLTLLIKLALTGLVLWVVLSKTGLGSIGSSISHARWEYLILALALLPPFLYLKGLQWQYLLNRNGNLGKVSLSTATASFLTGKTFSLILPAGIGDLGRVAKFDNSQKLRISSLVILDKVFQLIIVALCALPGVFYILGNTIGALASAACLAILLALYFGSQIKGRLPGMQSLQRWKYTQDLSQGLEVNRKVTTVCLGLTICITCIYILQGYLLVRAFELNEFSHLGVLLLGFPLVALANNIPFTIGGTGVREGAAYYALPFLSVSETAAVSAAFSLFLIDQLLTGLVGIPVLLFNSKHSRPGGHNKSAYRIDTPPVV